jgi:hypothetical protein
VRELAAQGQAEIDDAKRVWLAGEVYRRWQRLKTAEAETSAAEADASRRMEAALAEAQRCIADGTDPSRAEEEFRTAKVEQELLANRLRGAAAALEQAKRRAESDFRNVVFAAKKVVVDRLHEQAREIEREACKLLEPLLVRLWSFEAAANQVKNENRPLAAIVAEFTETRPPEPLAGDAPTPIRPDVSFCPQVLQEPASTLSNAITVTPGESARPDLINNQEIKASGTCDANSSLLIKESKISVQPATCDDEKLHHFPSDAQVRGGQAASVTNHQLAERAYEHLYPVVLEMRK